MKIFGKEEKTKLELEEKLSIELQESLKNNLIEITNTDTDLSDIDKNN